MSWAVTVCLGFAAALSITFPEMLRAMGQTGGAFHTRLGPRLHSDVECAKKAFIFYAGLNVIALILIFLFVPVSFRDSRCLDRAERIIFSSNRKLSNVLLKNWTWCSAARQRSS